MSKNAPAGLRYGTAQPAYGYCTGCSAAYGPGAIHRAKRHVEQTGHVVHWEQLHRRVISQENLAAGR